MLSPSEWYLCLRECLLPGLQHFKRVLVHLFVPLFFFGVVNNNFDINEKTFHGTTSASRSTTLLKWCSVKIHNKKEKTTVNFSSDIKTWILFIWRYFRLAKGRRSGRKILALFKGSTLWPLKMFREIFAVDSSARRAGFLRFPLP